MYCPIDFTVQIKPKIIPKEYGFYFIVLTEDQNNKPCPYIFPKAYGKFKFPLTSTIGICK